MIEFSPKRRITEIPREDLMIVFKEDRSDADLRQIGFLYSRLHLLFVDISQAFFRWSLKQEGLLIEADKSPVEEARLALLETDRVLAQLKMVERKFNFDKPVLEKRYREELADCQIRIEGMAAALNAIWRCGKPSKREVPFGDTTNYKFIINRLVLYMDTANGLSRAINGKAEKYSKANGCLLPVLKMMTAPPWARSL